MSICEDCILYGRCSGRCGDTDPLYYAEEAENDAAEEAENDAAEEAARLNQYGGDDE